MAEDTAPKLPAHRRDDLKWQPGQSGNPLGRPKGARNKLGETFIAALEADFNEHGIAAIEAVRRDKPEVYVKVVAGLLPKDVNLNVNQMDDVTDDELIERIRALAAVAQPFLGGDLAGGGPARVAPADGDAGGPPPPDRLH